jgi:hypothetical protein
MRNEETHHECKSVGFDMLDCGHYSAEDNDCDCHVCVSEETTVVPATEYEAVLLLRRIAQFLYSNGIVSDDWKSLLSAAADVEYILDSMGV